MGNHWRTARQSSGDNQLPGLHVGAGDSRAELLSFPSGSVLEPLDVPEPPLNKFSVVERALVGVLTGIALVSAFFILFFVET